VHESTRTKFTNAVLRLTGVTRLLVPKSMIPYVPDPNFKPPVDFEAERPATLRELSVGALDLLEDDGGSASDEIAEIVRGGGELSETQLNDMLCCLAERIGRQLPDIVCLPMAPLSNAWWK
jgi:hypothetical protein